MLKTIALHVVLVAGALSLMAHPHFAHALPLLRVLPESLRSLHVSALVAAHRAGAESVAVCVSPITFTALFTRASIDASVTPSAAAFLARHAEAEASQARAAHPSGMTDRFTQTRSTRTKHHRSTGRIGSGSNVISFPGCHAAPADPYDGLDIDPALVFAPVTSEDPALIDRLRVAADGFEVADLDALVDEADISRPTLTVINGGLSDTTDHEPFPFSMPQACIVNGATAPFDTAVALLLAASIRHDGDDSIALD